MGAKYICTRFQQRWVTKPLMKATSSGQCANFQTTDKQGENEPYHKWIYCNYP